MRLASAALRVLQSTFVFMMPSSHGGDSPECWDNQIPVLCTPAALPCCTSVLTKGGHGISRNTIVGTDAFSMLKAPRLEYIETLFISMNQHFFSFSDWSKASVAGRVMWHDPTLRRERGAFKNCSGRILWQTPRIFVATFSSDVMLRVTN